MLNQYCFRGICDAFHACAGHGESSLDIQIDAVVS